MDGSRLGKGSSRVTRGAGGASRDNAVADREISLAKRCEARKPCASLACEHILTCEPHARLGSRVRRVPPSVSSRLRVAHMLGLRDELRRYVYTCILYASMPHVEVIVERNMRHDSA